MEHQTATIALSCTCYPHYAGMTLPQTWVLSFKVACVILKLEKEISFAGLDIGMTKRSPRHRQVVCVFLIIEVGNEPRQFGQKIALETKNLIILMPFQPPNLIEPAPSLIKEQIIIEGVWGGHFAIEPRHKKVPLFWRNNRLHHLVVAIFNLTFAVLCHKVWTWIFREHLFAHHLCKKEGAIVHLGAHISSIWSCGTSHLFESAAG